MRVVSTQQTLTRFSTVAEVAQLLRVSQMTIHRAIQDGSLPAFRVGRSIRIPTKAVWEYLGGNRVDATWAPENSVPARALPLATTA